MRCSVCTDVVANRMAIPQPFAGCGCLICTVLRARANAQREEAGK